MKENVKALASAVIQHALDDLLTKKEREVLKEKINHSRKHQQRKLLRRKLFSHQEALRFLTQDLWESLWIDFFDHLDKEAVIERVKKIVNGDTSPSL